LAFHHFPARMPGTQYILLPFGSALVCVTKDSSISGE
jgi:hypothetical protein